MDSIPDTEFLQHINRFLRVFLIPGTNLRYIWNVCRDFYKQAFDIGLIRTKQPGILIIISGYLFR